MAEESPVLLPPEEEFIEAETDLALEPEPESGEPTPAPTSEPGFVCDCEALMHSACAGLPFYDYHESKRYCVLHYPSTEKDEDFYPAFIQKINAGDFDFRGVFFPGLVYLSDHHFNHRAVFSFATFSEEADFSRATFEEEAYFSKASFCAEVFFKEATFKAKADFFSVKFSAEANLGSVTFSGVADFSQAVFSGEADFSSARFHADGYFKKTEFVREANFCRSNFETTADFESSKFNERVDVSEATIGDLEFYEATVGGEAEFTGAVLGSANFIGAVLSKEARFHGATFEGDAFFSTARFSETANFTFVTFTARGDFRSVTFRADAIFCEAKFSKEANFSAAEFYRLADFSGAVFQDYVRFIGERWNVFDRDSSLDFQYARIEKPEHVAFHTLALRPHWFVNVDARKFDFTNVRWLDSLHDGIESLITKRVPAPHRLLSIAYRQLALNAEENHRYDEASGFRYQAMSARRLEAWHGFAPRRRWRYSRRRFVLFLRADILHWFYWLLSGYGERVFRAFVALAGIWLIFGWLYTQVGFTQRGFQIATENVVLPTSEDRTGKPLEFSRSLTYSLAVMSLQKPEPKPLTGTAQTLVLLETILGPVQGALLALAIRRKFMR